MLCPACGLVGEFKFCSECGIKMIAEKVIVICNGEDENGKPCQEVLDPEKKFCPNCGKKIDKNRFMLQKDLCKKCQRELKPENKFCPECGEKRHPDKQSDLRQANDGRRSEESDAIGKTRSFQSKEENKTETVKAVMDDGKLGGQQENPSSETQVENDKEKVGYQTGNENIGNLKQDTHTSTNDIGSSRDKSDNEENKEKCSDSNQVNNDGGCKPNEQTIETEAAMDDVKPGGQQEKTSSKTRTANDNSDGLKQDTHTSPDELVSIETNEDKSENEDEFDLIDSDGEIDRENKETNCEVVFHDAVKSQGSENTQSSNIGSPNTGSNINDKKLPAVTSKETDTKKEFEADNNLKKKRDDGKKDKQQTTHYHANTANTVETNVDTGENDKGQQRKENDKGKMQTNNQRKAAPAKPQKPQSRTIPGKNLKENFTIVRFHVLIGEEFQFDPKKHRLILRMNDNWDNKSREFEVKRQSNGLYEMEYDLRIPHNRLKGQYMLYKYSIFKPAKNEWIWECYLRDGYSDDRSNRVLHMANTWTNTDVVNQYDGHIEKTWNKVSGLLFDWKKQLIKHAKSGVEYFCKDILDARETCLISNCFQQLCSLMQCFKKIYIYDGRCWDGDESLFKKDVGGLVLEKMVECSTDELNKNATQGEKHERLVVFALAAVLLVDRNFLPVELNEHWKNLCKQLVMKPGSTKKQCIELDIMDGFFPDKRDVFKSAFQKLAREFLRSSRSPSWMFLMPWIHFLSRKIAPFEKPPFDPKHDDNDAYWWGISSVANEVSVFKSKAEDWDTSVSETLKLLQPMFEMDYFLQRTFIASLNLRQLTTEIRKGVFGNEVCLAALIYHLRIATSRRHNQQSVTQELQYVIECMQYFLIVLEERSEKRKPSTIEQDHMSYLFATQLFEEGTYTHISAVLSFSVHILLHCYSIYELRGDEKIRKDVQTALNDRYPKLIKWMDYYFHDWNKTMEQALKVWNDLYEESSTVSASIRDSWNKQMSELLDYRLQIDVCYYKSTMEKYVELYCQKVDTFKGTVQNVLSVIAFKAIEKGYSLNYDTMSEKEANKFGGLLSALFLQEWSKCGDQNKTEHDILQHFLKWPPFTQFVTIYAKKEDTGNMKFLSGECQKKLKQVVCLVQQYTDQILKGDIFIETLDFIRNKDVNFAEIAELVKQKDLHRSEFISKAIEIRWKETEAFRKQIELMGVFATHCRFLKKANLIGKKAVVDTLKKQDRMEWNKVKDFCKPANVENVKDIETFDPKLCAFDVSEMVLNILPELQRCSQSIVFELVWKQECSKITDDSMTFDDVVLKVWQSVKKRWDAKANQIQSGEIAFKELEKIVGKLHGDKYEDLFDELKKMDIEEKKIENCLNKLKKYRELDKCIEGAKTIWSFKEEFNLKGDFKDIQMIAEHADQDTLKMKDFDDNVTVMCDALTGITLQRIDCLNAFIKCKKLVNWLKESMGESGLKELKVFVDLAFMSAGEEPINCARVRCLHTAVTGYAALIFDLREGAGYRELLKQCSIVWKELENNKDLPRKLIDTDRYLDWLKDIKNAHGSVEVTSLMQTEAINATGTYYIGKNVWNKDGLEKISNETGLHISDVLKLRVQDNKENREAIQKGSYSFTELQDLQSRLMLVAGQADKSTESVDVFTSVFDSLTRLSNVYTKLWSSGCLLFKDFSATFRCNTTQPVCISLAFGEGKQSPILKGTRSLGKEDLKEMVPDVAKFMENCHEEWLQHFKLKRKRFLHLNFFTVDQLVILQRELVKLGREEPSHFIYPLLGAVKKNCAPEDLINAMIEAKKEINERNSNDNKGEQILKLAAEKKDSEQVHDLKRTFIDNMVKAGFTEGLALKALVHIDPKDVAKGLKWCLDNDDVEDDDDADSEEENNAENEINEPKMPTFHGWSESTTDIQTLIKRHIEGISERSDKGSAPLIHGLELLWKMFLESISSNIRDYLSLEDLGYILKHLAAKNTEEVHRSLVPGLIEGQPNLIVCPSDDVLMTTLTVYINQPLPLSDEVLLCTAKTSKDEVDIFLRRALFDGGRKIHCLVNADMLDYDVSEAAEKYLEEHLLEVPEDSKYRLIVICGSENEYRSGIVSSLDKYKCQPLPTNVLHLREYLANKLKVLENNSGDIKPAARVDQDRSTVRVVKSWRAGVGKSLYKLRREEELCRLNKPSVRSEAVSIPLQEKTIDMHYVIGKLQEHATRPGEAAARLFHIDISYEVRSGVDYLLFNLLILDCLMDTAGYVWRRSRNDIYLIETMPLMIANPSKSGGSLQYHHTMLAILPDLTCRSPKESLNIYHGNKPKDFLDFKELDQLFDDKQFCSPVFQRPFQYLIRLDEGRPLNDVKSLSPEGTTRTCLITLLKHCGLEDPSWLELHHFVWFLNTQLEDFEKNSFVSVAAAEDLPGFNKFVLLFLIQMSRDFSTRSLYMSEESPTLSRVDDESGVELEEDGMTQFKANDNLKTFQMKRTWESSPHPYLFFNTDRFTFTFLGFNIERTSGNLIDLQTGNILEKGMMTQKLYDALIRNQVNLQENFDALKRDEKLRKLCNVMGVNHEPEQPAPDPDDTYELTTDNVKKILAIYMRFRCDIPVIIMGETGCGKTRLVKFMCALQVPPGDSITNMILMKVHGGTTNKDIMDKVREAEEKAQANKKKYGEHMFTVLFFDEANTTEAIGLIKEIMCDKSVNGEKLTLCENLKMVAACNPYRKHSEEFIEKLEQSGLGYHVKAKNTKDRFGDVPMRRLVYRVQPLPQSLLPMVWDFGQLNTKVEDLYIRQMVKRYIREQKLPNITCLKEVVSAILTASQAYMRQQEDECSFVSLRDVDRVLTVMNWFFIKSQNERTLYDMMDYRLGRRDVDEDNDDEVDEPAPENTNNVDDLTRSLILALGVCYHACLKTRSEYREHVAQFFRAPCELPGGPDQIKQEIECCQEIFLDNVQLGKNIASNMALKENVFMMVVCIELRIPLFLVGKPGSSKSLAKTIVSDAMQGNAARKQLFKELKQVQVVSFQCSPLSTPDGIVGTFRQCAQFQKDKDLDTFASIVVLDEVGLAEDSPRMPLKTLHPLLEDGCQGNEKPKKYKKVAFIGISNWALDPAKMNRGILVQREVPDLVELQNTASGICKTNDKLYSFIESLIEPMAMSYLDIFKEASQRMREFYGLRDFYSLVKMVYSFVEQSKRTPTWKEMQHAILRNFGGLDLVDPEKSFKQNLLPELPSGSGSDELDNSPSGLIQACLFGPKRSTTEMSKKDESDIKPSNESRYLLLLTENYGALNIIQQKILSAGKNIKPITIFGSSFRSDQEYTQVCRNINKIKGCMETGNTVVLLNLENLYESLYDALNQYYVYFGGERYVDLGLGTHRVKCPVHKNFRLIVVAETQTVYKKFPIPLINRLEKHFLTINTMLNPGQQDVAKNLEKWVNSFVNLTTTGAQQRKSETVTNVGDVFIGYHDDTCSAIVLDVCDKNQFTDVDSEDTSAEVLDKCKYELLWCATPESLFRLKHSILPTQEQESLRRQYFENQAHDSIIQFLQKEIDGQNALRAQVTTHSKLMASVHREEIGKAVGIATDKILLLETLSSFETEQQFTNRIKDHIKKTENDQSLMMIQCDCGDVNANLIACARYCVRDELQKIKDGRAPLHVLFIIQLPRGATFTGLQCGVWHSAHIDDLYPEDLSMPTLQGMQGKSVAAIFRNAVGKTPQTETNKDILGEKPLSVKGLVLRCVPPALSMVKNKDGNTAREMNRVSFVRNMLHKEQDEGSNTFFHGICCLLQKLLMEKEVKTHNAQNWMINEAASNDNINKAGTFRRSCLQALEAKVYPVLAVIIAFLDTNENLSLLDDNEAKWKRELWLAYVNNTEALSLKYSDLLLPTRLSDLQEVEVVSTGCEGHMFRARMPFSWLLISRINEILTRDISHDREVRVLYDNPIGRELATITEKQAVTEAIATYIHDFVHIMYKAATDQEHQLVIEFFQDEVNKRIREQLNESNLLQNIVHVHVSYKTFATRLPYFRAINNIWPDCSSVIVECRKSPDHYVYKDQDFTFSALKLLMEDLKPEIDALNRPGGRDEWLDKVHKCRPVVEKVIGLYAENQTIDSSFKEESVHKARTMWSRIVVVKLYFEHLCTATMNKKKVSTFCSLLWTELQNADLKKSLTELVAFLDSYNQRAMKDNGFSGSCVNCDKPLTTPPLTLPCSDIVCDLCASEMAEMNMRMCPKCKKNFPDDWKSIQQLENTEALEKMKDSQKRCNTFFMDVVSQLCFADNIAPSQEVVNKLLEYIFFTTRGQHQYTREFTIFTTGKGLDPNPVFRSFLLQLLARTSEEDLKENLKIYFDQAAQYIKSEAKDQSQQYVELSVLVIQCLEDMFVLDANKTNRNEVVYATNALQKATFNIADETLSVQKLYCLANARMGLSVLAKCLANTVSDKNVAVRGETEISAVIDSDVIKLTQAAHQLFEETGILYIRTYLVKILCKSYGLHSYQTICRNPHPAIEWINCMDIGKVVEISDRYIVCGKQYTAVRESLTKFVIETDTGVLESTINDLHRKHIKVETIVQLAVFREITCSKLYSEKKRTFTAKAIQNLQEFFNRSSVFKRKDFLQALLSNQLKPRHLVVNEGADLRLQGIQCLVVHFIAFLTQVDGSLSLLHPLKALMETPQTCAEMYLPTMPQDDLDEIKAMFSSQEITTGGEKLLQFQIGKEKLVFYRCPNGHAYSIGECGRASTVSKCYKCGADIGGKSHNLIQSNKKDAESVARKETGHILGSANFGEHDPETERTMTPATCAILRLFVHLSMYASAGNNLMGIQSIITPKIETNLVEDFLWAHIQQDIGNIHRALGRSEDDVILLMHTLIDTIMTKYHEVCRMPEEICRLSTKNGRQIWEKEFSSKFVQEPLQNLQNILQSNNQLLATDQRLGVAPLQSILCEIDNQGENENVERLQEIPRVWRFRIPISLAHLRQEVMSLPSDQHKILQLFLQEEHYLRALRYIPSILRLHRVLFQKYQRRLDKAEASQITVAHLRKESDDVGGEMRQLILDFAEAWELVRHALKFYTCPTDFGMMAVPKELCHEVISDNTPISSLLPTTKEAGLCSYALLDFLFRKQNEFLDNYLKETKRKPSSISLVKPKEVTSAHLISYDPQYDIKSLLLANCQHSFEIGKGTKIEYDFAGLERQFMDRFLFSKSRIDIGRMLQIDLMVYRTEFTNADVFKKLEGKIEQDVLSPLVKTQICNESRSLPDVCQSLDNLDITISFLTSTGGQPERNLHSFMLETLQMETTIHSSKAQQTCEFKHIKSLWLLLSYHKSKIMTESRQQPSSIFESVSSEFHEDLSDGLKEQFQEYAMKRLSIEKLSLLLEVLHEYILLVVAVRQNAYDEDYMDTTNHVLCEWLPGYADDLDPDILTDFPKNILYKHTVYTWIYAYRHLREKQTGNAQN